MSCSAGWLKVESDVASSAKHFGRAILLYREGGFTEETMEGYKIQMAFMHAMMAGYTSFENMLTRILAMLYEKLPTGPEWHADLIRRVRAYPGRRRLRASEGFCGPGRPGRRPRGLRSGARPGRIRGGQAPLDRPDAYWDRL